MAKKKTITLYELADILNATISVTRIANSKKKKFKYSFCCKFADWQKVINDSSSVTFGSGYGNSSQAAIKSYVENIKGEEIVYISPTNPQPPSRSRKYKVPQNLIP